MGVNLSLLKKVRCRFLDRSTGMPVPGIVASLSVAFVDNATRLPVATLCTDATGYMSFDLKPLIDLELPTAYDLFVSGLFVSAPKFGLTNYDLLGSLVAPLRDRADNKDLDANGSEAAYVGRDMMTHLATTNGAQNEPPCIVFPIYLENRLRDDHGSDSAACETTRLPSIQSPDACDYKVSPFSFVTPAALKLGNDCCESLLPSSLPIQQYRFNKVVVRRQETGTDGPVGEIREVKVFDPLESRTPAIKFGEVLEYRQDWHSLGHSLGEIKYSLPLAPGESTQLAVIEWSRDDFASRTDNIRAMEFLDHDSHRERAIEDTVEAALREEQGGNSHMGSTSGTASGNTYGTGMWTGNHAFGGGISYSYGNRDLEGESLQDLHDRVRQASSFIRSLNSTVIVQASQTEKNTLQTRRVANHNHCHALTIQYYEVLRHYRMTTNFLGRRQAVLIPFALFKFDWKIALRFRTVLEQTLLDPSLSVCFEALIRLKVAPSVYEAPKLPTAEIPTATEPSAGGPTTIPKLGESSVQVKGSEGQGKASKVKVRKNDKVTMRASGLLAVSGGNGYGSGGFPPRGDGKVAPDELGGFPFLAPGLLGFSLVYKIGLVDPWRQVESGVELTAHRDGEIIFGVNNVSNGFADWGRAGAQFWTVDLEYPSHETEIPTATDPSKDPARNDKAFRKSDDELCEARLLTHLNSNQGFYNGAVWMLLGAVERRLYLEAALQDQRDIFYGMDDKPIAISGNYVAFPYTGPLAQWNDTREGDHKVPMEDIVTLPTRGLFAEAQIGHCNSCEKRDVTRMWDWTEMTAETPPDISGISPGPKGQMPSITQGQLPTNVIQITQPQNAPDPTGLANALNVLKTPEIFRDMSGLDEVSKLLGELAKASGDANTKAVAMQAKEKVEQAQAAIGSSGTSQKQTPAERYDNLQVAKEAADLADEIGLSDEQKADVTRDIIGGGGGFLSNVRQMVEQGFLGGVGSAARGKAVEAGVELVFETAKGAATSALATPDVEFAGFNGGTALLSEVPDSAKYVDGPRGGFVEFHFMDLGGTPLQDGIGGQVRIDWANCALASIDGLNFPRKKLNAMVAIDCKRDIAATSALRSGKAISKAVIRVELLSGYAPMQRILDLDSSGNPIDSSHEVVPKVQLTINIERSALALGGRIGPWSKVFELKNPTIGGIGLYILGNDNGEIKLTSAQWQ